MARSREVGVDAGSADTVRAASGTHTQPQCHSRRSTACTLLGTCKSRSAAFEDTSQSTGACLISSRAQRAREQYIEAGARQAHATCLWPQQLLPTSRTAGRSCESSGGKRYEMHDGGLTKAGQSHDAHWPGSSATATSARRELGQLTAGEIHHFVRDDDEKRQIRRLESRKSNGTPRSGRARLGAAAYKPLNARHSAKSANGWPRAGQRQKRAAANRRRPPPVGLWLFAKFRN